jgi:hypothetical protein
MDNAMKNTEPAQTELQRDSDLMHAAQMDSTVASLGQQA